MTFVELQVRANRLAKSAIVYLSILFVITAVVIICVAPRPSFIGAGLVLSFLGYSVIMMLCLLPSWVLDKVERFRRPLTKSEIASRVAKRNGLPVIDVKVSDMDPQDLRGLPLDS